MLAFSKIVCDTEAYRIQYRILESLYSGLHSKLQGLAQADREFGRAVDPDSYRDINTVIKISAVLPLAALLDGHRGGSDLSVVNQSHLPPDIGKKDDFKGRKRNGED